MAELKVRIRVVPGHVRPDPQAFQKVCADGDAGVVRDMHRRGQNVLEVMYVEAPKDTGRLQQTFRMQPGTRGSGYGVTVIAGREGVTPYLGFILDGTPAHEIRAKRNRPNPHLRFVTGGRVVFARRVRHPGTRANNFMLRALPAARR